MAGVSEEEKKRIRELTAEWLAVEKKWRASYYLRAVLTLFLLPLYYIHGALYAGFVLLVTAVIISFLLLFCIVACFKLDKPVRYLCKKLGWCERKQPEEEEDAEAKRQQIIAAGGDPDEAKELNDTMGEFCLTRYQKRMFESQLWTQLVLFSPGRFLISKQITEIRKKSEALLLQRSTFTYLLKKETVLELTEWPKHEQALAQHLLVKTDIANIKPPQAGSRVLATVLFVSHKWVGNMCDTEKNEVLAQVKERLNLMPQAYVWFDYSSVPQEDAEQRMLHLRSIPDIISRSNVGIFLHESDPGLADKYMRSIWCQLEYVLSGLDMKNQAEREWTIFDCNDLYLILPAFINMTCQPQNYVEIFGGLRKTGGYKIFGQILKFFANWHDQEQAKLQKGDSPV